MDDALYQPNLGGDLVAEALSRDLDRPVIYLDDGGVITARRLRDDISRYAQAFQSLEPPPVRAALLSKNRVEVPAVFYAISFAGIISTALHPLGSIEDFLYVIEDAEIDLLVYDDGFEEKAQELYRRASRLKHLVAIGKGGTGTALEELASGFIPHSLMPRRADPEAIARIAYSGGTTGKPKGIVVTQRGVVTSTLIQLTEWEWPDEIRHLICSPLSHAGASVLTAILQKGGSMMVLGGFDPVSFMEAVQKHRITSALMVPTMVLTLLDHPRFGEFDLSSLQTVFYGASAFPAARLREAIDKLGPVFFQFYGQAEAPMSVTVMRKADHLVDDPFRLSSCGRPTPWVRVALLDDDCKPVPDGEPGEICVQGPLLMGGYLNKPEETEKAFEGGWLHTGDVAVRNAEDGFLRIVDRKKDMIVTGGFNVYAREVEDVIAAHPGVKRVAVFGVPDSKWGEAVKAVVVADAANPVSADELIAKVKAEKGSVQAPKSIDFVGEIPLSPVGKPDKKALKALYSN
ncbi:AMP-binding protein [Novosphingobium malaysiense]|uniref:Acyl-CoA synthetase n=1 Tax=Novosphingobium malaysiense TaxID=1348853 RepID=A0A0B1ZLN0_9SPHN|nr:AMP-binding protein [Novosphingobium malaysiense]KHK90170.1 acyl-CoA synthetase [Novosphingobium malaysiense]